VTTARPTFVVALVLTLLIVACWSTGCQAARRIVQAQTPGTASGAGASVTGPANSAAPTTQKAERTMGFRPRAIAPVERPKLDIDRPAVGAPALHGLPPSAFEFQIPEKPEWIHERVETSIGEHQDAAGIVKVAVSLSKWNSVKWLGLMCVVVGLFGIAWSYNNDESGYPLVFIKVAGAGVLLIFFAENPWWLLVLMPPAALYIAQKLNLLRLP
jgi:hypothetical protein